MAVVSIGPVVLAYLMPNLAPRTLWKGAPGGEPSGHQVGSASGPKRVYNHGDAGLLPPRWHSVSPQALRLENLHAGLDARSPCRANVLMRVDLPTWRSNHANRSGIRSISRKRSTDFAAPFRDWEIAAAVAVAIDEVGH